VLEGEASPAWGSNAPPTVAPRAQEIAPRGRGRAQVLVAGDRQQGCAKNWRQGPGNEVRAVCILMAD